MSHLLKRIGKVLLFTAALIAVAVFVLRLNRTRTVKAYYRLERSWGAHENMRGAEQALEHLEPLLTQAGILGPARIQVEPAVSFLLDPRDLVPLNILRTGEWQPEIWNAAAPVLPQGGVFLDVGAHIGYFSMKAAARVGPTGRVVAFEPNPETLQLLRDNVAANHFSNVVVEPIACTEREQTLTLYAASIINTGASSLAKANADVSSDQAPRAFTVRGRPIDDVVHELGLTRVDAVKIDVEGAEVLVLRGAIQTLKRFHPKVIVEVVARQLANFQTTPEDLAALMRSAGYTQSRSLSSEGTDVEWTAQEPTSVVRVADPGAAFQLVQGFHELEGNAWRWTAQNFTVALKPPALIAPKHVNLVMHFSFPEVSFKKLGSLTISPRIGGIAVPPQTFASPGEHQFTVEVPAAALNKEVVQVDFALDKVIPPTQTDPRSLGIVITSVGFETQ